MSSEIGRLLSPPSPTNHGEGGWECAKNPCAPRLASDRRAHIAQGKWSFFTARADREVALIKLHTSATGSWPIVGWRAEL